MRLLRHLTVMLKWGVVATETPRRTARVQSFSVSNTNADDTSGAAALRRVSLADNTQTLLLHFNLSSLPPALQREFDVEANQRALRHLALKNLAKAKSSNNGTTSDTLSNQGCVTPASASEIIITPSTVHHVMWRCAKCNAQWSARPSDRANQQVADAYRCPRCYSEHTENTVSIPREKPSAAQPSTGTLPTGTSSRLCDVYPSLAAQWDTQRNELLPNNVLQGDTEVRTSSSAKVWWRCPLCCTPWLESVSSRVARYELATHGTEKEPQTSRADISALVCPACERRGVSRGAASSSPLRATAGGSSVPRRWLCDDHLLFSEALLRPSQSPSEISLTSETVLQWRCRCCQFEYTATVANRFLRHERCPQCTGREKSMMNLLVIQRPDVIQEVSKNISRTRLRHITVHDDVELPFVCRACFSPYRMTARARCAVPRGVPACSKCFWTNAQVLAEARQQSIKVGTRKLSSRELHRVRQKALQLSRSNRNGNRLAATVSELRHRDDALKD